MKKFSKQWWKEWFKASSIRAMWTFCQTMIAMVTVDSTNILKLDWKYILLTSFVSCMYSYAKSFVLSVPEIELANYRVKEIK